MQSPPDPLTIVIPCYNEAPVVAEKIENCLSLDYPRGKLDVILVDDWSTDETLAVARRIGERHQNVQVLSNRFRKGKSGAVLTGIEAAASDLMCITDADVMLEKRAVRRAVGAFREPEVGLACGIRLMRKRETDGTLQDCDGLYDRIRRGMILAASAVDSAPAVHGPMIILRRSVGVVPDPEAGIRADDVDLPVRMRKRGLRARVVKSARFYELAVPPSEAARQAHRRALGIVQAMWLHRDVLFNPRYGLFGLLVFPVEFAFYFLQPAVVFGGATALASCFALSIAWGHWGVSLALFCVLAALCLRPGRSILRLNAIMAKAIGGYLRSAARGLDDWEPPRRQTDR